MGWVMMLNVWGVIWRAQKKIIRWTADNAANGTPMPDKAKCLARQAFLMSRANFVLSFPMLFLTGAASNYLMFGKECLEDSVGEIATTIGSSMSQYLVLFVGCAGAREDWR